MNSVLNEPLLTTLADAANLLDGQGIPYALVGGVAVSFRAQPRMTADVDFVIAADVERAVLLAARLEGTPFQPLVGGVEDVVRQSFILPLKHRATKVKLDLALGLSGFEQEAIARAERREHEGVRFSLATVEDLLMMKVLAGRPQDEQDVRGLVTVHGKLIDWDYCRKVAAELQDALGHDLVSQVELLCRS